MSPKIFSSIEPLEHRIAPATFTVTTVADVGAGSLRQAVLDANAAPGLDTIKFALPAESVILLLSQVDVTDSVNILGPGANKVAISGGNTTRLFNIDDGVTNTIKTVKIAGLTMRNGNAGAGNSGGAILDRETLTVENCMLYANTAGGDGGAIKVSTAGKFLMKNTKVTGNSATGAAGDGGGLYVNTQGGALITGSVISGNTANDNGGGLYGRISTGSGNVAKVAFVIDKTVISGNSAVNSGGGLWILNGYAGLDGVNKTKDDGASIVRNSVITGNRVTTTGQRGGGLYLGGGNALVQNSTIANNTVVTAGGGLAGGPGLDSLVVKSSKISGNSTSDAAGQGGGGAYIRGAVSFTFQSATISGNLSASDGGGIMARDGALVKIIGSTFSENRALGDDGGAIYVDPDGGAQVNLDVLSSKFFHNRAFQDGGSISTVGTGLLNITSSQFNYNFAGDDGGAIDTTGGSPTVIKSSKFTGNVTQNEGGAMYLRRNTAITANGGAMSLGGAGVKLLTKTTIRDNYSGLTGGGLSLFGGSLSVVSSIITGNIAKSNGGGIANYVNIGALVIATSNITGNSAASNPQIRNP